MCRAEFYYYTYKHLSALSGDGEVRWRPDHEAETVLSGDLDNVLETATAQSQVTERLLAHAAGVVSVSLWQRVAASW